MRSSLFPERGARSKSRARRDRIRSSMKESMQQSQRTIRQRHTNTHTVTTTALHQSKIASVVAPEFFADFTDFTESSTEPDSFFQTDPFADFQKNHTTTPVVKVSAHTATPKKVIAAKTDGSAAARRRMRQKKQTAQQQEHIFEDPPLQDPEAQPQQLRPGFSFDAFGLDSVTLNQKVDQAMHDLNLSNPEFFFQNDTDESDHGFRVTTHDKSPMEAFQTDTPSFPLTDEQFQWDDAFGREEKKDDQWDDWKPDPPTNGAPERLPRAQIQHIQSQLGRELLSPERLEHYEDKDQLRFDQDPVRQSFESQSARLARKQLSPTSSPNVKQWSPTSSSPKVPSPVATVSPKVPSPQRASPKKLLPSPQRMSPRGSSPRHTSTPTSHASSQRRTSSPRLQISTTRSSGEWTEPDTKEEPRRPQHEENVETSRPPSVADLIKQHVKSKPVQPVSSPRRSPAKSPARPLPPSPVRTKPPARPESSAKSDVGDYYQSSSPRRRNSPAKRSPRCASPALDDEQPQPRPRSEPGKVAASAAVSHMLMLQQIQRRPPASPPKSPVKTTTPRNLTLSTSRSDEFLEEQKQKTPKATKMMLNAFLAGRQSIGENGSESVKSPVPEEEPAKENSLPALKDDPTYERYFKMLSIGMPMEVVKHAMTRDGLDPAVMDGDHNKPVGVPLKDDPAYDKYFKMLKIGLPLDAVKHSMERDGLDSSVMDQDHDLPVALGRKPAKEEPKEKDSHRRARLHWKTLRQVTSNSLWAQINQDDELNIEIDEKEFQELFQAEKTEAVVSANPRGASNKRSSSVCVIDAKRANNGGIILARLKMSHDDMADAVDRIEEHTLTAEQIEHIVEYLPSKDEGKALEAYMLTGGQDAAEKFDALCECEKFMVSMMTVKHAKRKVSALLFKLRFEDSFRTILQDASTVEKACDELINSTKLRQLLGIVLTFGNRLNTAGNGKRKAGAFTLDSLLKLRQAKAFDKKTTFLHYIILIVQRNNGALLDVKEDISTVFSADKIFWDQCIADLEDIENQLENVRKIALYQAKQALSYRFRRKSKKEDPDESLSDSEEAMTLEEEVEALRATPIGVFALSAIKFVSSLRDKVEGTKEKFARLLEYFGEQESGMQTHELFSTIVTFCRDFQKAREEVDEIEKKKQREERKRKAAAEKKTTSKASPMLKVSNHQPSMGNVLQQLKSTPVSLRKTKSEAGARSAPAKTRDSLSEVGQPSFSTPQKPVATRSPAATTEPRQAVRRPENPSDPLWSTDFSQGSAHDIAARNSPKKSPSMQRTRTKSSTAHVSQRAQMFEKTESKSPKVSMTASKSPKEIFAISRHPSGSFSPASRESQSASLSPTRSTRVVMTPSTSPRHKMSTPNLAKKSGSYSPSSRMQEAAAKFPIPSRSPTKPTSVSGDVSRPNGFSNGFSIDTEPSFSQPPGFHFAPQTPSNSAAKNAIRAKARLRRQRAAAVASGSTNPMPPSDQQASGSDRRNHLSSNVSAFGTESVVSSSSLTQRSQARLQKRNEYRSRTRR